MSFDRLLDLLSKPCDGVNTVVHLMIWSVPTGSQESRYDPEECGGECSSRAEHSKIGPKPICGTKLNQPWFCCWLLYV